MRTRHLLTVAAWLSIAACSIDTSLFSEGEVIGGGTGAGSSTTSSTTSSTSSSPNPTSSQQSSVSTNVGGQGGVGAQATVGGTGGVGGQGAAGGQGGSGGTPMCAHDACVEGDPLDAGCDPCVTDICNEDPFCCNQAWDNLCTYQVLETCGQDCNGALPDCETQHSQTTGFDEVCGQNGDICSVAFGQTSCGALCFEAGTECLQVFNNVNQTSCDESQMQFSCELTAQSAICICSRGCGGGQPCQSGQVCSGGQCL